MRPRPEDEKVPSTSAVAPGAITALLRDVFRLPQVVEREAIPEYRPGEVIGRFELVRELGRGGFGVVYEAADRQLRRSVAVKAVRMGGDVGLKEERLLREAEAAAQLSHPNIVTLFDVGTVERGPYLVMELLRGATLSDRLRSGALHEAEALRIATDVARAVAHAHASGVIHRDLTAGNVFLCEDGTVKVLDFGMAQAFGHHRVHGGTVAYMAPEQYRGEPEDERTDVFALGVILYEMLTGSLPFGDAAALESPAAAPIVEVPARPLGPLVARMLAKDPTLRPRDGRVVLAALVECQRAPGEGASRPRRLALALAPLVVAGGVAAIAAIAATRTGTPAESGGRATAAPVTPVAPPERPREVAPVPAPVTEPPKAAAASPAATPRSGAALPRPTGVTRGSRSTTSAARVRFCRGSIDALPTPEPATGDGVLTIEADPYGDVFVDGRPHGETPLECQVAAGTYTVRLVHPQLGARERRVDVGPGQRAPWVADFLHGR